MSSQNGTSPTTSADQTSGEPTEEAVVTLNGQCRHQLYRAGETMLQTARRAGLSPRFACESGDCACCMALLREGRVKMVANNALSSEDLDEGWVLTCQGYPVSKRVVIQYPD